MRVETILGKTFTEGDTVTSTGTGAGTYTIESFTDSGQMAQLRTTEHPDWPPLGVPVYHLQLVAAAPPMVRCWYCDKWMAEQLGSCPFCRTARLNADDWHGAVNKVCEAVNAKPITQWLYRVLEQDEDGDPLDFGAVTAASLTEAQQLVAAHLTDILGDTGWLELPVRFYPVTGTTGVWASDRPFTDADLVLPATGDDEAGR